MEPFAEALQGANKYRLHPYVLCGVIVAISVFLGVLLCQNNGIADNLIYPFNLTTTLGPKAMLIHACLLGLLLIVSRNAEVSGYAYSKKWILQKVPRVVQQLVFLALFVYQCAVYWANNYTTEHRATKILTIGVASIPNADLNTECCVLLSVPLWALGGVNYFARTMRIKEWLVSMLLTVAFFNWLYWYGLLSVNVWDAHWDKYWVMDRFPKIPQTPAQTLVYETDLDKAIKWSESRYPFIAKPSGCSTMGIGVTFVRNQSDLEEVMRSEHARGGLILQERAVCCGNKAMSPSGMHSGCFGGHCTVFGVNYEVNTWTGAAGLTQVASFRKVPKDMDYLEYLLDQHPAKYVQVDFRKHPKFVGIMEAYAKSVPGFYLGRRILYLFLT